MTRLAAAILLVLAGPALARGEPPPAPPAGHPVLELAPGQQLQLARDGKPTGEVVTVPERGGVYLDPPQFDYQRALRAWHEHELRTCVEMQDARPVELPKAGWIAGAVGLAAGVALGVLAGRAIR